MLQSLILRKYTEKCEAHLFRKEMSLDFESSKTVADRIACDMAKKPHFVFFKHLKTFVYTSEETVKFSLAYRQFDVKCRRRRLAYKRH